MDTIKRAPFSPVVTGAALYLLTRAPLDYRQPALQQLRDLLSAQNVSRLITSLKWLFAFGLVRNINSYLSELSLNNWQLFASKKDWDWPNEVAVVTGASSGFGKLFSLDLAAKGIRVAALDINDLPADIKNNPRITFFKCNVTDMDAVNRVADEVRATLGRPSILINNAGVAKGATILDSSPEWIKTIFDVNLVSHYYLIKAFVPDMVKAKKGHVVSIASIASFISGPGMVDYCATKAGLQAIHEGLTAELRHVYKVPQILTTIVHPGWADTAMIKDYKASLKKGGQPVLDPQVIADAVVKQILSCRSGKLILMRGGDIMSTVRSWPLWLSWIPQTIMGKATAQSLHAKKVA